MPHYLHSLKMSLAVVNEPVLFRPGCLNGSVWEPPCGITGSVNNNGLAVSLYSAEEISGAGSALGSTCSTIRAAKSLGVTGRLQSAQTSLGVTYMLEADCEQSRSRGSNGKAV